MKGVAYAPLQTYTQLNGATMLDAALGSHGNDEYHNLSATPLDKIDLREKIDQIFNICLGYSH